MDAGTARDGTAQARGRRRRQQLAVPGVLAAVGGQPAAGRAGPRRPERKARRAPAHAPGSCVATLSTRPRSSDQRGPRLRRNRARSTSCTLPSAPARNAWRHRARRAASAGPSAGSRSAAGRVGTVRTPGAASGRSGMRPAFNSRAKPTLALGMPQATPVLVTRKSMPDTRRLPMAVAFTARDRPDTARPTARRMPTAADPYPPTTFEVTACSLLPCSCRRCSRSPSGPVS